MREAGVPSTALRRRLVLVIRLQSKCAQEKDSTALGPIRDLVRDPLYSRIRGRGGVPSQDEVSCSSIGTREKICKTSRGGTLSTCYLLRLAKFAQEKCEDDNTSSSQVQQFPSIREKRKEDCFDHTAPSFLALGRERKR